MTNTSLNTTQNTTRVQLLLIACIIGAVMGVIFIIIQPFFGMDTLTSRHAAAYQQLGNWNNIAAVIIAWTAHLVVSIFYGFLSGIVILSTTKLKVVALFTLAFSWLTTLIAPPANALIVQFVSFQQIQISQLPDLNFSLDVKLLLHLVFFAAMTIPLYLYHKKNR